MKRLIVMLVLLMLTQSANATWVHCNKIVGLHSSGDAIHFKTDVSDPNSPCLWKNTWELERSNPAFDEIYKMILTARATGDKLWVSGKSQCNSAGHKQKVSSFLLGGW